MATFFNDILYRPLFNALIFIYHFASFNDMGVAIVVLTIIIRLILWPLFHKTAKHQKKMLHPKFQSELKRIQERNKNDREKQAKELMQFYKDQEINPFTPLWIACIQLPLVFALYGAMNDIFSYKTSINLLYSFVPHPAMLNTISLGIIDLSKANIVIIIIAVALQYYVARLALPKQEKGVAPSQAEKVARSTSWLLPIITLFILLNRSSALGIYWCTFAIFSICQQLVVNYRFRNDRGINTETKGASKPNGL